MNARDYRWYLNEASTLALSALLLFAGVDKLLHYPEFVNALSTYSLLSLASAPFMAMPVIVVELLLGAALWLPSWRRPAAFMSAALLTIFTLVILLDKSMGGATICGCWFSVTLARSGSQHVLLNLVFATIGLTIASSKASFTRQDLPTTT